MTTKQRVERLAASQGITIERETPQPGFPGDSPIGQLVAPDGFQFGGDSGCHSLTFPDWDAALADLNAYLPLVSCAPDCDCQS